MARSRHQGRLDRISADDWAVDAKTQIATGRLPRTAQPKQAPKPQAIGASMASSQATPRSAQIARTASSIGGGPQA